MIGKAVFLYPIEFSSLPDYNDHSGQIVKVLGVVDNNKLIGDEEIMYHIEAEDSWRGVAYSHELDFIKGKNNG